jgi:hypothetical protein
MCIYSMLRLLNLVTSDFVSVEKYIALRTLSKKLIVRKKFGKKEKEKLSFILIVA